MRARQAGGALVLVLSMVAFLAVLAGIGVAGALRACRLEREMLAGTRAALAADDVLATFLETGPGLLAGREPGVPVRRELDLPPYGDLAALGWYEARVLDRPPEGQALARVRFGARLQGPGGAVYRQEREAWVRLGEIPEIVAWRLAR
ncbi:MAG TPA: hypothetical protein VK188_04120 [Holophaga sp.]|nr:hypothetical protein [Holophaga sp.]